MDNDMRTGKKQPLWIRMLLRVYPREIRSRHGREIAEALRKDKEYAARKRGIGWRARFWTGTVADNLGAAIRLRWESRRGVGEQAGLGSTLLDDVRQAGRMFRRSPGFQVGGMAILALGIGSAAAAFAIVDGVLLRPLPYPEADRLVQIGTRLRMEPGWVGPFGESDFLHFRDAVTTVEAVAAGGMPSRVLSGLGDPEQIRVAAVSEGYLDLFGARAALGRTLQPSDHAAEANPVAVLEHGFWISRFGGDPDVLGSTISLSGTSTEIIGVLEEAFLPPPGLPGSGVPIWTVLGLHQRELAEGSFYLTVIGRAQDGLSAQVVAEEADRLIQELYPPSEGHGFVEGGDAMPLRNQILGESRRPILLAQAGVGLLLLITCVNMAGLLLSRALDRHREMAVRSSLGAGRMRILRQVLGESLLLSLSAGLAGVGVASVLVRLFKAVSPGGIPRLSTVTVDARVALVTILVAVATGVIFGLAPAFAGSRVNFSEALKEGGRGRTDGKVRSFWRQGLVAGEVALAAVLVLAAGLMINSFLRLSTVDPGFERDGLASVMVDLRPMGTERDQWGPFFRQLLDRGSSIPGVRAAALTTQVPFTDDGMSGRYTPENLDPSFGEDGVFIGLNLVSEGYFDAMGIPLLDGRPLTRDDGAGDPVVVVNQAFLRTYWPDVTDPVGRLVKSGGPEVDEPFMTVVGVVGDVVLRRGEDPPPALFVHFEQETWRAMSLMVRVDGDPAQIGPQLRSAVRDLDPGLPIRRLATVDNLAAETLVAPRFYTLLAGAFGVLALTLALVGVYATASYTTGRRVREIGIRKALGARDSQILSTVMGGTLGPATLGVLAGLGGGLLGTRLLANFLFGVSPNDPFTIGGVGLVVAVCALLAAYGPARRAASTNPAESLRRDA